MAAVYDLFGNGKTAIKVNVGKYLTALTASNSDPICNPGAASPLKTTRTWNEGLNPAGSARGLHPALRPA